MNPYMNEDVMFERLKDQQREMENGRLIARELSSLVRLLLTLGERAWLLAGLATRRPPRRRPVASHEEHADAERATEAA